MPLATMASGLAAITASTLTLGAMPSRSANTLHAAAQADHVADDLAPADRHQRLLPGLVEDIDRRPAGKALLQVGMARAQACVAASRPAASLPPSMPKCSRLRAMSSMRPRLRQVERQAQRTQAFDMAGDVAALPADHQVGLERGDGFEVELGVAADLGQFCAASG
jgi:hypothetical protein